MTMFNANGDSCKDTIGVWCETGSRQNHGTNLDRSNPRAPNHHQYRDRTSSFQIFKTASTKIQRFIQNFKNIPAPFGVQFVVRENEKILVLFG